MPRRIIDLSLPVDALLPAAEVEPYKSIEREGWRATMLHLYSHCGTHMDAPCHFLPSGQTMDRLNLEAVCGAARIVNIAPAQPSQWITIERFESALTTPLEIGERILLRTDWYKRYPSEDYRNRLPRISLELAAWMADKQVRLLGVEPPSVADVNNRTELTEVHQTLFRAGVVIVEGLAHLDQIPDDRCEFIALPLNIVEGDGCPVRAIAIAGGEETPAQKAFGFARA